MDWHALSPQDSLAHWGADSQRGLSDEEARKRQLQYGLNRLQEKKGPSPLRQFLSQFTDLIVLVLIAAALLSGLLQEWLDTMAILAIVFLNALLGFIQEYRAEKALQALKRITAPTARVLRDGELRQVPAEELVPGDIIALETGDLVPADSRLLEARNLKINESSLTGESMAAGKEAAATFPLETPLADRRNMAYSSTIVTYGRGRGLVVATGMGTELGRIAHLVQTIAEPRSPLQKRLDRVGQWLVYTALVISALIFGLGIWQGAPLEEIFLTAVSLAVAAVPEGLAAVVTISLALGVRRMVRRHALIRRLTAVETLGSATVICTDKTGTLTENEMTVKRVVLGSRILQVTGEGYTPQGVFREDEKEVGSEDEHLRLLLTIGALCNDAQLSSSANPQGSWKVIGDPMEGALLVAAVKAGLSRESLQAAYPRMGEIPFDSERKRMTTIHRPTNGEAWAMVKGAPEVILDLSSWEYTGSDPKRLDEERRQNILEQAGDLASQGMRLLGMAYRVLPGDSSFSAKEVERGLTFVGFVALQDPPRPEVKRAVAQAQGAGIEVVMITGDHAQTATAIAQELGLFEEGDLVLTGEELDRMDDGRLQNLVERIRVYARVSPEHKLRIVEAWRGREETVAMTGDGVNDAPALKEADIGIAMGIMGTDVTKESSDMVLADDNFATIVAAVEEGRAIFDNIRRFIHYLLSCNIGEVLAMLMASLLGTPLPLLPIQILWINLVTDSLPALALGVEPAEPGIMERPPRPVRENIITRSLALIMSLQGALIGILTLGGFIIGYYLWGEDLERARMIAFSVTVFAQNVHAFNVRNNRLSLFQLGLFSNPWLLISFALMVLSQLAVIYLPLFQPIFRTSPLTSEEWWLVAALGLTPLLVVEFVKLVARLFPWRALSGRG